MNNTQESQLKMFRATQMNLDKNKSLVDLIPAMAREAAHFKEVIINIDKVHPKQAADNKGVTTFKNVSREELGSDAITMAGALFSYGTHTKNADLCQRMIISESSLSRYSIADYIKFCNGVNTELIKAGPALVEYGITASDATAYGEDLEVFKTTSVLPRNARVEKSSATSDLLELFSEGNAILADHLDTMILQFRKKGKIFFKEYNAARIIEDHSSRPKKTKPKPPTDETKTDTTNASEEEKA